MGCFDAFMPEEKIDVTKSEYHALMKAVVSFEVMSSAVKHDVPAEYIKKMFDITEKENAACQSIASESSMD